MRLLLIVVFAAAGFAPVVGERAQQAAPPELEAAELAARASRWTARFDQSLSGLLFREVYLQRALSGSHPIDMSIPDKAPSLVTPGAGRTDRLTEANIFLLKAPTAREFVFYRDVYSENRRKITDHTDRLAKLLTDGTPKSMEQVRQLTNASARSNVAIVRNVNIPTMALEYLTPAYVGGLRFKTAGSDVAAGLPVVIVAFEEVARPTLVRAARNTDAPAQGRFWIHPETGTVVRAFVTFAGRNTKGKIDVVLQLHETLQVWVPKEMHEVWQSIGRTVTGVAHYDNFQRLNVSTTEIIK